MSKATLKFLIFLVTLLSEILKQIADNKEPTEQEIEETKKRVEVAVANWRAAKNQT